MTARPKFLFIKKFRDFQHYHTRGAPWIKLYAALLSDPEFLALAEAAQAQLMKLWLLASQFGHPLPNNPKLLAGKIGTTGRFHLQAMIDAGFIIPRNENASNDASESASTDASNHASTNGGQSRPVASGTTRTDARVPERREDRVESSEIETTPPPQRAREFANADQQPLRAEFDRVAAKLESDDDRRCLRSLLSKAPVAQTFLSELDASLAGMPGHVHVTPTQAGRALRDFVGNGECAKPEPPRLRSFRRYLELAAVETPMTPRPPTAANGAGDKADWQLTDAERWDRAAARLDAEEAAARAATASRAGVAHG